MKILRLISLSLVTMVMIPMGVNAHCDPLGAHSGDHPHCSNVPQGGDGEFADNYSINITGEVADENAAGFSGALLNAKPKQVSAGTLLGQPGFGLAITFDSIVAHFYDPGENPICFPTHHVVPLMGARMPVPVRPQVIVNKGKKGRAEAKIWFRGSTDPADPDNLLDSVLYLLVLLGKFNDPLVAWPPPPGGVIKSMDMDRWVLSIESPGANSSISCIEDETMFTGSGVHIEIRGN